MKVLVIGAVGTTALTIKMLLKHSFSIVGVLGHNPMNKNRVSGIIDLRNLCEEFNLDFFDFNNINSHDSISWGNSKSPDIIFAVGFSQLLSEDWLNMSQFGCIGFHPTDLPKGRGRAPIAWTVLEKEKCVVNFFRIGKNADEGKIFIREEVEYDDSDDATSLVPKIRLAIEKALDKWLPEIKDGILSGQDQDESLASYYGKREPCDSLIDWSNSAKNIDRLIKASAFPHPGAFTFCNEEIITIWKSRINETLNYKGVIGRILNINDNNLLIQCGFNTSIWIEKYDKQNTDTQLKIGDKLGFLYQNQIDKIINNYVWKKE
jgi:methionyl-tRNA formyltransferase